MFSLPRSTMSSLSMHIISIIKCVLVSLNCHVFISVAESVAARGHDKTHSLMLFSASGFPHKPRAIQVRHKSMARNTDDRLSCCCHFFLGKKNHPSCDSKGAVGLLSVHVESLHI